MAVNVVQCVNTFGDRIVAFVDGDKLRPLKEFHSVYDAAWSAAETGTNLETLIRDAISDKSLDYDEIYELKSDWKLLPPFDHPRNASNLLVTGTGLSHRKSADNRNAMHSKGNETISDSMKIYQWGIEGGQPAIGQFGTAPEWFWKGDGDMVRSHGETLVCPWYGEDGGEEAEIAGVYIVGPDGQPLRVGFAATNEFSDHVMESRNYLYLAPSKLRECSIGPELVIGGSFDTVEGEAAILRGEEVIWAQPLASGEPNMVHSLANLEHHHFKYPQHRRPGDAHIYFFGTPGFSYGSGIRLEDGDVMFVRFDGYGRPLLNVLRIDITAPALQQVRQL